MLLVLAVVPLACVPTKQRPSGPAVSEKAEKPAIAPGDTSSAEGRGVPQTVAPREPKSLSESPRQNASAQDLAEGENSAVDEADGRNPHGQPARVPPVDWSRMIPE